MLNTCVGSSRPEETVYKEPICAGSVCDEFRLGLTGHCSCLFPFPHPGTIFRQKGRQFLRKNRRTTSCKTEGRGDIILVAKQKEHYKFIDVQQGAVSFNVHGKPNEDSHGGHQEAHILLAGHARHGFKVEEERWTEQRCLQVEAVDG